MILIGEGESSRREIPRVRGRDPADMSKAARGSVSVKIGFPEAPFFFFFPFFFPFFPLLNKSCTALLGASSEASTQVIPL